MIYSTETIASKSV